MAIPFYEPRQQHHANECDQIDGNFPPAPSSQSMSVPTASTNMTSSIVQPTYATIEPTAAVSSSALIPTPNSTLALSTASSSTAAAILNPNVTPNIFVSPPSLITTSSSAGTATFSFSSNNPVAATASLSTQTTSTDFISSASSTSAAPGATDPLPWKLLAVSMCKALKQYYQQNASNNGSTTAVIEILPSGVSAAQE